MDSRQWKIPGHSFQMSEGYTLADVVDRLREKVAMRTLLEGGPIAQPEYWAFPFQDIAILLAADFMGIHIDNIPRPLHKIGFDPSFTNPDRVLEFRDFQEAVLTGRFQLPVIYKPNVAALGIRNFYLSAPSADAVTISMYTGVGDVSDYNPYIVPLKVRMPQCYMKVFGDEHVTHFTVPLENSGYVLFQLWGALGTHFPGSLYYATEGTEFDSGMIEAVLPVMLAEGRACETRYTVTGNLATGEGEIWREECYTRVGSSPFHSNVTLRRRGTTEILDGEEMYAPLVAVGNGRFSARQMADADDALVQRAFAYLSARLLAAGVSLDVPMRVEFDLMRLRQEDGATGLPQPVLIESNAFLLDEEQKVDLRKISVPNRSPR